MHFIKDIMDFANADEMQECSITDMRIQQCRETSADGIVLTKKGGDWTEVCNTKWAFDTISREHDSRSKAAGDKSATTLQPARNLVIYKMEKVIRLQKSLTG